MENAPPYILEGSIVRLKSGGPPMTCEGMQTNGFARCTWFDGFVIMSSSIHAAALVELKKDTA